LLELHLERVVDVVFLSSGRRRRLGGVLLKLTSLRHKVGKKSRQ